MAPSLISPQGRCRTETVGDVRIPSDWLASAVAVIRAVTPMKKPAMMNESGIASPLPDAVLIVSLEIDARICGC
jgi:hypothetical protein